MKIKEYNEQVKKALEYYEKANIVLTEQEKNTTPIHTQCPPPHLTTTRTISCTPAPTRATSTMNMTSSRSSPC